MKNIKYIVFLQISNPLGAKPGLRFCTLPHSYSEATMRRHYPTIHEYMNKFNKYNVTQDAIAAVKDGYTSGHEADNDNLAECLERDTFLGHLMPISTTAWYSTTRHRRTTNAD